VTGTANFQDLAAGGFNDYDPNIGDLKTVKFAEEFRTDEWLQTSLVIEGDLGFAQLVSATSYYDREIVYQHDTNPMQPTFIMPLVSITVIRPIILVRSQPVF
jgi:hypothetical protein